MVQMHGLRRLHQIMCPAGDYKAHFQLTHNGINFDCLFLVDVTPYEFVLAAIGHPDVALLLPVQRGYFIEPDFGDDYKPLAKLFDRGAGTFHPFSPAQFLREIDRAIPGHYRQPMPAKIIQTYRHHVEHGDRPYFLAGGTTICAAIRSATPTWLRPSAASGRRSARYASARTRVRAGHTSPPERSHSSCHRPNARSDKARNSGLVLRGSD